MKNFILLSFILFIFFSFSGYFFAYFFPDQGMLLVEGLAEKFTPIIKMPPLQQLLAVIFNNLLILFLTVILGIFFGVFPFVILFINSFILGVLAYFSSWPLFIVGIFPHGIIELPILISGCALGFKLAGVFFRGSIKKEIKEALLIFFKILTPLLILAGLIEIFITPILLSILI